MGMGLGLLVELTYLVMSGRPAWIVKPILVVDRAWPGRVVELGRAV